MQLLQEPVNITEKIYLTVKESVIAKILGLLIYDLFFLIPAAFLVVAIISKKGFILITILSVLTAIMGLIMLIAFSSFLKCMKPANWLLIYTENGFYLKFRSFLNASLPWNMNTVVFIDKNEIESLNKHIQKKIINKATENETVIKMQFLDITLNHADTEELKEAVAEEIQLRPKNKTVFHHYPVQVADSSTVRVEWKSDTSSASINLDKFLLMTRPNYRIEQDVKEAEKVVDNLDDKEFAQNIVELVKSGHKIDAITAVRNKYGYGLAEAKQYVERLVKLS